MAIEVTDFALVPSKVLCPKCFSKCERSNSGIVECFNCHEIFAISPIQRVFPF